MKTTNQFNPIFLSYEPTSNTIHDSTHERAHHILSQINSQQSHSYEPKEV